MKNLIYLLFFLMLTQPVRAQSHEVKQLLLNVEKLRQFKSILSDMKKGYRVIETGYNAVKDVSEGNFNLHEAFLDGLLAVSPEVKKYHRVLEIISNQKAILEEYKQAFKRFKASGNFTQPEIGYLSQVYGELTQQSLQNINDLAAIVTSSSLRMNDGERLRAINRIFETSTDQLRFLRSFNRQASILNLQRTNEKSQIEILQKLTQP